MLKIENENLKIDFNKLKGTKTEHNLRTAFGGESEARNKYEFFASVAEKEGYKKVAEIFKETANNEKQHAKIWFKILSGISNTKENLESAVKGEKYENEIMYLEFSNTAKQEGFEEIAELFEKVRKIEKRHEERYIKFFKKLENYNVYKSEKQVFWKCEKCGYVHFGNEAPEECPLCSHKREYFIQLPEEQSQSKEKSNDCKDEDSIWRCKYCNYTCSDYDPPEICPVCRRKEAFFKTVKS